jgi:hypothetical protein
VDHGLNVTSKKAFPEQSQATWVASPYFGSLNLAAYSWIYYGSFDQVRVNIDIYQSKEILKHFYFFKQKFSILLCTLCSSLDVEKFSVSSHYHQLRFNHVICCFPALHFVKICLLESKWCPKAR